MQPEPKQYGPALLVTGDLIFSAKIVGTARALGIDIQCVATPQAALDRVRACEPRCTILDLGLASTTQEHMKEFVQATQGQNVLAFGSHVDVARLQQARDAGCTEVMPRSRLSNELPALLERYCEL